MYAAESRLQDAGLIRNFIAVLIGDSLAVHYRQSDVDRALGVRSLKLSMSGSTSVEQNFVLETALQRHPRLVIWQLDDWTFFDAPDIDTQTFLQADLYRMNLKGVAAYLFSLDTARESFWISLHGIKPVAVAAHALAAAQYLKFFSDQVDEINTLPRDTDLSLFYNSTRALSAFEAALKLPKTACARYNYPVLVLDFDRDTLAVIKNHPDVQFVIFFPSYSILQLVAIRQCAPDALRTIYGFNAHMLRNLTAQPNVRVFDFRDASEITYDFSNYLDMVHHFPNIDQKVPAYLAAGKHEVDRRTPTASIERLGRQVADFDIAKAMQQKSGQ